MADVSVRIGKVTETHIVPVQESYGYLYTAVSLQGEATSLHLSTWEPRVIERGRMVVASLTAALDALEDAVRRKNAVSILDLAPDPVNMDDLASTELREDDIEYSRRTLRRWTPEDGPRPAA